MINKNPVSAVQINENPGYGSESFLPYTAYLDDNGKIIDTMFDTLIFVPSYDSENPGESIKRFIEGGNLESLDRAMDIVKDQLSISDHKISVGIKIHNDLQYEGKFQELTGYILNAVKAYGFTNIILDTFAIESRKDASEDEYDRMNRILNAYDASLLIIDKDCFLCTSEDKPAYDIYSYQPEAVSEMDPDSFSEGEGTKAFIFMGEGLKDPASREFENDKLNYLNILKEGYVSGYIKGSVLFCQPDNFFYLAAYSNYKELREIYDLTYKYIKKLLAPPKPVLIDEGFGRKKNGQVIGKFGVETEESVFEQDIKFNIDKKPEQGLLVLKTDGSFVYTPYCIFKGSDSFHISASNNGIKSTPAKIAVNKVNDRYKTTLNDQNEAVLAAKRAARLASAHKKTVMILAAACVTITIIVKKVLLDQDNRQ